MKLPTNYAKKEFWTILRSIMTGMLMTIVNLPNMNW